MVHTNWVSQSSPGEDGRMPKLLTEKEVRSCLNISRDTLRLIVKSKQLTGIKVGRLWRFRQSDVDRYLSERENTRE